VPGKGRQPEISSFRLHLAAEGMAAKAVRTYTETVQWFATAHLLAQVSCTRWEEVGKHDVQRSTAWKATSSSCVTASCGYGTPWHRVARSWTTP
jgi:hypothetical protein